MTEISGNRPRLADIAKQAGVSTATVSRVLNGKAGASDEVRRDVLAALDLLGYERPRQLRFKSRGLVGLIVPELSNPIFPNFAQTIESLLAQRGYTAILCTQSPGGTTEDEYIEMLLEHGVDGMVIVSGLHADTTADKKRYRLLRERGIPLAFINGWAGDEVDGIFVANDDEISMATVVRHLTALGHERIGLACGPDRFVPSRNKIAAFTAAMSARFPGFRPGDSVAISLYTVEGGSAAAGSLIDSGITAIICASDLMALGAIRAARARGLRVPEDISVVGYDDSPMMAFVDPPLTTIQVPVSTMSHAAVSALTAEINGDVGPRTELRFRAELIVRGSTDMRQETRTPVGETP